MNPFDGNLSGLEFDVHEDYTIFKEKSYGALYCGVAEMGIVSFRRFRVYLL